MTHITRTIRRPASVAAACALVMLAASACSSGGDGTTSSAGTPVRGGVRDSLAAELMPRLCREPRTLACRRAADAAAANSERAHVPRRRRAALRLPLPGRSG